MGGVEVLLSGIMTENTVNHSAFPAHSQGLMERGKMEGAAASRLVSREDQIMG